ncbi:hypothetical protein ACU6TU_08235 [Halomonas sp. LS-001]
MNEWRVTGQAGWDDKTGEAVYFVTKGSTSLNVNDHDELKQLLKKAQEPVPQQEPPTK